MTSEQMKSRLDKAINVINAALNDTFLLSEGLFDTGSRDINNNVITVLVADFWPFSVHFEEIRHNTDRTLVNLVRVRLAYILDEMSRQVLRIPVLKKLTPPTKIIQGL